MTLDIHQFRDRFEFDLDDDIVHESGFANVYKARDKSRDRTVAIKIITDDHPKRWYPTARVLTRLFNLKHPHLVRYFEVFKVPRATANSPEPGFTAIVMDYLNAGDLRTAIDAGLELSDKKRIVEGIVSGLGTLHGERITHRNLKPGNVLIQDVGHLHVQLADYGFVGDKPFGEIGDSFPRETVKYLAPEQLDMKTYAHRGYLADNLDFWQLGILVYEIFLGKHPFSNPGDSNAEISRKILYADLPGDIDEIPEPYAALVRACLIRHASHRPRKVGQLLKLLEGRYTWERGRLRKRKREKQRPQPVRCSHCARENPPRKVVCAHCGHAISGPDFLRNYRRPGRRGYLALFFIALAFLPFALEYKWIYSACEWKQMGCDLLGILKANVGLDVPPSEFDMTAGIIKAGALLLVYVLAFLFLNLWYWRVSDNLEALGSKGRRYHPLLIVFLSIGFQVGLVLTILQMWVGIAIMVLGVFLPLMAFQEVWRGSNPSYLEHGENWKKSPASTLLFFWWLTWLLLPILTLLPFLPDTPIGTESLTWFYISTVLACSNLFLIVLMILRTNRRQHAKFKAWARHSGSSST